MRTMLRKAFVVALVILLVCSPFFPVSKSVSASTNQIFWGAWVGDSHKSPFYMLQDFEGQVGKGVAIWNWIQLWNRPKDSENSPFFEPTWMDECRNHGAIPIVSWSPEASDEDPNFRNLQDIVDGKEDAYLTAWGQASAAWGHPYFVRLMWEFTGGWTDYKVDPADPNNPDNPNNYWGYGVYPWSYQSRYGNGNTPELFVAAWQHIVNTVRAAGGTQISWVWCTGDVKDSVSTLQTVYPGDNYVDWVGTDIYLGTGKTFDQGAQPELPNIMAVAKNKPVMIPEIGYTGSDSGPFWSNLLSNILPTDYSYVKAVVVWEMPSHSLTVVDAKTLTSFKQAIASDYYLSNIYSSLAASPLDALSDINPTHTSTPRSQPTPTPASTSTHSLSVSSGFGWSETVIVGVIAAVAVVAVSCYSVKKKDTSRTKNKNREIGRRNQI